MAALVLVTMVGCSRGPDAPALRAEVQGKLDQRFKPGLFELVALRRQGRAPLPASESGGSRLAVYFNATLKVPREYDFGNWEGLSSGTLAQVLGATEKGIIGVKTGQTRPGELIRVYGSSTYRWADGRGQGGGPPPSGVAQVAAPGDAAPPSRSRQLIDRLAALVEIPPPGVSPQDEQMITEELERAVQAITARRDRRQHIYVVAGGPDAGEYQPIVRSMIGRAARLHSKVKVSSLATSGSVGNARLIGSRHADFAICSRTWPRWRRRATVPSRRAAPSRRSGRWAACSRSRCTSWSRRRRGSGRSRTCAGSAWRSARGIPARGPMPSRSWGRTDSPRRTWPGCPTTASKPRPAGCAPAKSTPSSPPSARPPGRCSASPR